MKRCTPEQFLRHRSRRADPALDTTVRRIIRDVRRGGANAVRKFTRRFDGVDLRQLAVAPREMSAAWRALPPIERRAIQHAAREIRRFARLQRRSLRPVTTRSNGIDLGHCIVPMDRVGVYVPGGRYPLISTVLMNVIPAQEAGVPEIVLCTPPGRNGRPHPGILAACHHVGVRDVFAMGGAQAIAALAYGIHGLPRVHKIIGPGNKYVARAKEIVSHDVAIDFFAGPTELMILADEQANPWHVACDLLSQAEHDPDARTVLVTTSGPLIAAVAKWLRLELRRYPQGHAARLAAAECDAVLVPTWRMAVQLANASAPEHLQVIVKNERQVVPCLRHYGSLFLGPWSAVAFGDYASGTNHTLPTGGAARVTGGLSIFHFLKIQTWQRVTPAGVRRTGPVVMTLAGMENLEAHRRSVAARGFAAE